MATADGQLLSLNLTFVVWGISIHVTGTVEVLNVRREV